MAFDKKGKYHMNPAHAKMADGAPPKPKGQLAEPKPLDGEQPEDGEPIMHTTLNDHGDGTFHTEGHDGEEVEHPSIHHALSHIAQKHGHDELAQHIMDQAGGDQMEEPGGLPMHAGSGMSGY